MYIVVPTVGPSKLTRSDEDYPVTGHPVQLYTNKAEWIVQLMVIRSNPTDYSYIFRFKTLNL